MSKVNLKDDIWIEGFDSIDLANYFLKGVNYTQSKDKYVVYVGKTSEIPEEVAKECVFEIISTSYPYRQYCLEFKNRTALFVNAKQSIQSACDKPYCIIYKTK